MSEISISGLQLAAISEMVDVARSLDSEIWLRGGWAMDFYLGRLTREHLDVDWYVWDGDMPVIANALVAQGWTDMEQYPAEQQRDLVKGAVEFGIAPLSSAADGRVVVGGGPWRNAALPKDILANALECQLGGIQCAVISPAAQIEIKQMMPTWVPGLPRRSKDAADMDLLAEAVKVARLDRDDAARGTCP
ncbi:nucleotidyltransferase domain-containing protein [Microbacterium sp. Bi128]|uniref:nucleotidyltransferase domain-containing protein n=1 Tax=Microbacterium sp. Bi128 TaxID=2821115 RepID=UPI001E3A16DF|nr:hypothetical protein [Microbacterium sp. Bi128]